MLSFHGKQEIKDLYMARLKEHHRLDEIIQGTGYDGARGCAVGCTLNNYSHSAYEKELGLPAWIAHLEDKLFEGVSKEQASKFAVAFLEAIPVGVDVEPVRWKLAIWRHSNQIESLRENKEPYVKQCSDAIQGVIEYCEARLASNFDVAKLESARSAARSAAESAAESAAYEKEAEMLLTLLRELKN